MMALFAANAMGTRRRGGRRLSQTGGGSLSMMGSEGTQRIETDKMPASDQWLHHGPLYKHVVCNEGTLWQIRELVLLDKALLFARLDSDEVLDSIPLEEIADLKRLAGGGLQPPNNSMSPGGPMPLFEGLAAASMEEEKRVTGDKRKIADWKTNLHQTGSGRSQRFNSSKRDVPAALKKERFIFEVKTVSDGKNGGRSYTLMARNEEEGGRWVAEIKAAAKQREKKLLEGSYSRRRAFRKMQEKVRRVFESDVVQGIVSVVILVNFAVSLLDVEIQPTPGSSLATTLGYLDIGFLCFFCLELFINAFANWWEPFFKNGWNMFDAVIVLTSIVAITRSDLPGVSLLRLVRVFRILRLFRRLRSLRTIINSLLASIVPVANAFLVLLVLTCLYAAIATSLFKDRNPAQFGFFSSALFTMFQVCTGDGWATDVVRPMVTDEEGGLDGWAMLFFISYVIIVGTFLVNIVVAVLLDEFVSSVEEEKGERNDEKMRRLLAPERATGPLDPLLKALMHFNSAADLQAKITWLYRFLDADDSGGLDFDELHYGLRRLKFDPPIYLSQEDFDMLTENGALVDVHRELSIAQFQKMIRAQLSLYLHRLLHISVLEARSEGTGFACPLLVLNHLMLSFEELIHRTLDAPAPPLPSPLPPPPPPTTLSCPRLRNDARARRGTGRKVGWRGWGREGREEEEKEDKADKEEEQEGEKKGERGGWRGRY